MRVCRREFNAALAGAIGCGLLPALPPRPKLLVLVVLEQFRPDYLESTGFALSAGGFRRLIEKGTFYPDCRNLASTFPSSSLATLATGAWPSQHGIVADQWYDRSTKATVEASDELLQATTFAAQVAVDPRSRVAVFSTDGAKGELFAGTPDARQFWIDDVGRFTTLGDIPDWLTAYNTTRNPENLRNAPWVPWGGKPDGPALRTLTYSVERPKEFVALYRSSPFAQTAQFELALDLIAHEHLGLGNYLDLVCILAGATAALGYETGARSPLMQQMVLHLDRDLENLIAQLTKTHGEKGFNLIVAGAHGAPPEPPPEYRERMVIKGEAVANTIDRKLTSVGMGRVVKYVYPFLYLDTGGFRDPEPIRAQAASAALAFPGVADFYTAVGNSSTRDEWARRFRNSFHAVRSGDMMISYQPEYVEYFGQDRGISYGSLYNYDVRVPLFLYGAQFRNGLYEYPVESVDLAPTLARAMGVAPPSSAVGRVLGEAFAA